MHESWSPLRCHYVNGGRLSAGPTPRAHVSAWRYGHQPAGAVGFGAVLFPHHAHPARQRVHLRAWTSKQVGRVFVEHEIGVTAPETTVAFPGGPKVPEDITLSPPAPFTGTAAFTRTPESTFTWTGDLAVEFPGLGPIRLTGPSFDARMCALEGCVSQEPEPDSQEGELQARRNR